jgi:hypothetical protein
LESGGLLEPDGALGKGRDATYHDAGEPDDFADRPTDALEFEHGVDVVGVGFVLVRIVRILHT